MSIVITINNINDLTDTERAVLRLIAGNEASVADTLQQHVRSIAAQPVQAPAVPEANLRHVPQDMVVDLRTPVVAALDARLNQTLGAPAPASADLDANGLPWDKRIHSSSRAKVANGAWKYARNLDKALIATVEAELRAVQAIPSPATSITSTNPDGWPFTEANVANTFATHGSPELDADAAKLEALAGAGAAGPTLADVPLTNPIVGTPAGYDALPIVPLPPVPQAPAAALPMTFAQLMQHITPMLVSGKLTQPILQTVCESVGLPHLASLGARPDLVETVRAAIDAEVSRGL